MDKFKRIVLKNYPTAELEYSEDGYRVVADGMFLAEEYLFPDTDDADRAWEYAAIACKTTQNFNRTHPLRMDLSSMEEKMNRITKRKRMKNASQNKTKASESYEF